MPKSVPVIAQRGVDGRVIYAYVERMCRVCLCSAAAQARDAGQHPAYFSERAFV